MTERSLTRPAEALRGRMGAVIFARIAGDEGPGDVNASSSPTARAGSPRTTRSASCTVTRPCSRAASGRCCCSRCTRWRWRPSISTPAIAATRGDACSAPARSWRRRRSARSRTPTARSASCGPCTAASPAPRPTGVRTPHPTRTCCAGCTSPRSTASCAPTTATAPSRSMPRAATSTSPSPPWWREALGATDLPETVAELDEVMADYRPELASTAAARQAARFILVHPPVPLALRLPYSMLSAAAVGMMPRWIAPRAPAPLPPGHRGHRRPGERQARHLGHPLGDASPGPRLTLLAPTPSMC